MPKTLSESGAQQSSFAGGGRYNGLVKELGGRDMPAVGAGIGIERLIDRGLAVGYGIKTKEKLFIQRVRLTPTGRGMILKMRARKQLNLPLNKHARNNH